MEEQKIITLATRTYEHAEIIRSLLNNEGIECFLENVNLIQAAISDGVKIRIREQDLERAIKIMEEIEKPELLKVEEKKRGRPPKARVLLPVDYSDYSTKAAEMALDWAARLDAELTVLHVFYNPIINTLPFAEAYVYDTSMDELMVDLEAKAKDEMREFLTHLKTRKKDKGIDNVTIRSKLLRGVAEDEIIRFSDEYEPTVIIMGTRGKDRKASDLIGSVTAEVMESARVPVLAVPEDFEYKGIDELKKVLYATNFEESDFVALDKLEKLVKPLAVSINLAHVCEKSTGKWNHLKLDGLKKFAAEKFPNTQIDFDIIENEDFEVGIEKYVRDKHIDIISLTTRRRNIFSRMFSQGLGKKMLFHSTTPLLVFHARR
ncbi:universal stress protein [Thermophagus xiamenensis]|uniref:Nucleotide-binding universal stress protein, UspA family n=1 Tax=Thermophagus xiamenensis TaxID=385682 RepID=A0A1I2BXK0_9BACT|nr:universal stress protein [Thermophagus xiamenensis]SFE60916.1 Nucleotide-binding universal stress protein, UspA family [Thermophagus xiamenensis]